MSGNLTLVLPIAIICLAVILLWLADRRQRRIQEGPHRLRVANGASVPREPRIVICEDEEIDAIFADNHRGLDPLTAAVNRAFNTGQMVTWSEGDPVPDPEGPVRRIRGPR